MLSRILNLVHRPRPVTTHRPARWPIPRPSCRDGGRAQPEGRASISTGGADGDEAPPVGSTETPLWSPAASPAAIIGGGQAPLGWGGPAARPAPALRTHAPPQHTVR